MNRKRLISLLMSLVMLCTSMSMAFAENAETTETTATDITTSQPVELLDTDEFKTLYAMGIVGEEMKMTGKTVPVTRAQFTGYLFRLAGYTLVDHKTGEITFLDVSLETPYYNEICTMYEMGIVNGTEPERFSPDSKVTYAQACKLICDVLGYREKMVV